MYGGYGGLGGYNSYGGLGSTGSYGGYGVNHGKNLLIKEVHIRHSAKDQLKPENLIKRIPSKISVRIILQRQSSLLVMVQDDGRT